MRVFAMLVAASASLVAGEFPIGSQVSDIRVTDHGAPAVIRPAAAKATAIVFVSVECPVSNAYNERMAAIYKDYSGKDVQFAFVNANEQESQAAADDHAKQHNLGFKVYKDVNNVLADQFNAQNTPEVFLFDHSGKLVYHGRIDDSRELSNVKSKDFRAALDAVLAGQPVSVANTKQFGCTIKRAKKAS
jgi:thioredoxin-related protein